MCVCWYFIFGESDGDDSKEISILPDKKHVNRKLACDLRSPFLMLISKKMILSSTEKIMMDFAYLEEDEDSNIHNRLILVRLVINYNITFG